MERLIAETDVAEKSNEVDCEIPIAEFYEVEEQGLGLIINSNVQSVSIQTECFVRNKKVQTVDINIEPSKTMKTKRTQTSLTSEYLSRKLCPVKLVSSACQTSPISDEKAANTNTDAFENASQVDENMYPLASLDEDDENTENNQKNPPIKQLSSDPIPSDEIGEEKEQESADEENYNPIEDDKQEENDSEEEENDDEEEENDDEEDIICNDERTTTKRVMLLSDKPPKDQLKFIVFEESIANIFRVCFKCNACCNVSLEHQIGTYCKIGVFCSGNSSHNFLWTTGPLCNRLPIFNLMIAASIVSTGMECSKTLRFLQSLNIMCIQRRELSNLQ